MKFVCPSCLLIVALVVVPLPGTGAALSGSSRQDASILSEGTADAASAGLPYGGFEPARHGLAGGRSARAALPARNTPELSQRGRGRGSRAPRRGDDPIFGALRWRSIGPANMMGRIAAIEALSSDYRHVLVASASGGVFRSRNGGITWDAIFDSSGGAGSIGAVAMFEPDPDIIWVGTGEAANRNSSGWGDGLWKTTDGGDSWENVGLADTHTIAAIALHPTDPDIAYVAAPGHLWGYSGDRGLFKTTDGGRTWTKLGTDLPVVTDVEARAGQARASANPRGNGSAGGGEARGPASGGDWDELLGQREAGAQAEGGGLPNDGRTGCTEVIMEPGNPDVLYAGMYHRLRQPATMHSGGPNGGIFKSTDAGRTWVKLTRGLPAGDTGMIDISIHLADPRILVAAVEADENIPYDDERPAWENEPGGGAYISYDAGASWRFLLKHATRPFYHGQIEIDPRDPDRIYVVSRNFRVSRDGGETWSNKWWGGGGDDHDMWIAPYDSDVWYNATDQGAYLTVDGGETLLAFDNMAIGQYYKVGTDMRDPYWVIGGLQDNGLWMGPSNSRENRGILNVHNTWVAEGDGFQGLVDPTDWRTVYTVNHVGFIARQNVETREHTFITPTPETVVNIDDHLDVGFDEEPIVYTIDPGEHWFFRERPERPLLPPQFRFNWNAPLVMSPSNPRVLYFGANYLFKSIDRGDTWRIISPDLTTNDPELRNPSGQGGLTVEVTGGENHFTIFTIAESPLDPAVVWAGTDDGNVQVTRDGGATWTNARDNIPGIPERIWVSKVEASHHEPATAYVSFDNHRLDDIRPYVFKTTDFGRTWSDVSGDLPAGHSVYVVVEDRVNPDLLFVGTEFGAFGTIDGGARWVKLDDGMPTVAVRDLRIHPRDNDLIAGTHGRSIFILDDITPLQQFGAVRERQTTTATAAGTMGAPAPATGAVGGGAAGALGRGPGAGAGQEVTSGDRADVHVFQSRVATDWARIDLGRKQPDFLFRGENPPRGALIHYWLREPAAEVSLRISEVFGDRTAVIDNAPGVAGVNRAVWNLVFPTTERQRAEFKTRLGRALDTLDSRVRDPELRPRLPELRRQLEAATGDNALNEVRRALVREFNAYAGGRPLFGPRIGPTEAAPGVYRVELTVAGRTVTGSLTVRADPLAERSGS